MPPKRKGGGNAFYYFMEECRSKYSNKNLPMNKVAELAGPLWQRMSKEERLPYEERARRFKEDAKYQRCTTLGIPVDKITEEEKREAEYEANTKYEINSTIERAVKTNALHRLEFHIVHINTFCHCATENRYYPAEIAVSRFTLEEGVSPENVFHEIIELGELPLGYSAEAALNSKQSHQLPLPSLDRSESNEYEVYKKLKHFLQHKSDEIPVLYTDEKLVKMIRMILNGWCNRADERPLFRVYNLQYMFMVLRNACAGDKVWPSETHSTREIEKDVYDYAKKISCDFHENSNVPVYCSKSIVTRYAYVICDNCCMDLGITLIPGQHVPQASRFASSRASSFASGSTRSLNLTVSDREDTDSEFGGLSLSSKSSWDRQSVYSDISLPSVLSDSSFPTLGEPRQKGYKRFDKGGRRGRSNFAGALTGNIPNSDPNYLSLNPLSLTDNESETSEASSTRMNDFPPIGRGRGHLQKNLGAIPKQRIPGLGRGAMRNISSDDD